MEVTTAPSAFARLGQRRLLLGEAGGGPPSAWCAHAMQRAKGSGWLGYFQLLIWGFGNDYKRMGEVGTLRDTYL